MNKRKFRQWISSFLCIIMVISSLSLDAFAASGKAAENITFKENTERILPLNSDRLEELKGQEGVYFGTISAELEEREACYSLPVYREGDLESEAQVSLMTLDISALYGTDYELIGENIFDAGDEQTILQKYNENGCLMNTEEILENSASYSQLFNGTKEENEEEVEEENDLSLNMNSISIGSSRLDESTDSNTEFGPLSQSIIQSIAGEQYTETSDEDMAEILKAENLDFSAGMVLQFAAGESEKTVIFHIIDDEVEEGQEMFAFILTDAVGTVIRNQYTFSASINDSEELHDAEISFSQDVYNDEDGTVTVTILRSGSTYSMIDFYLRSVSDPANSNEACTSFEELLIMQPYQTKLDYSFSVTGQGNMEVELIPETACVISGSDTAEVLYNVPDSDSVNAETELLGSGSFPITFSNKTYTVKFEGDGKSVIKGSILDNSFNPAVKVGDYYFPTSEFSTYNKIDGDDPRRAESKYVDKGSPKDSYGYLEWYAYRNWRRGSSWCFTKSEIPALYYRYVVPYWEGCNEDRGYQTYELTAINDRDRQTVVHKFGSSGAKFSKKLDEAAQLFIPYGWWNQKIALEARVRDPYDDQDPEGELHLYGYALFSKSYDCYITDYSSITFKTAKGGTIEALPFNLVTASGAQMGKKGTKPVTRVYANADENQTKKTTTEGSDGSCNKLTFNTSTSSIHGVNDIYGTVTGYNMLINSSNDPSFSVKYPEDFIKHLEYVESLYRSGTKSNYQVLVYTKEAVAQRIKEAQNLQTISFDGYLIEWLNYVVRDSFGTQAKEIWKNREGIECCMQISFSPIVEYKDVKVHVMKAKDGGAEFDDPELKEAAKTGKTLVYHAGDALNMQATATDPGKRVTGYEISEDKGTTYGTSPKDELFLLSKYAQSEIWIRPLVESDVNHIEVKFLDGAEDIIEIGNLEQFQDENGKISNYILIDKNYEKTDYRRYRPEVGRDYFLQAVIKKQPADTELVYRTYFYDEYNRKTYTQYYPFNAKANKDDNVLIIGVETVRKSELKSYSLKGKVVTKSPSIKNTAFPATDRPAADYNVTAFISQVKGEGGNQFVYTDTIKTDEKGEFTFEGIQAKEGDVIPIQVTCGYGAVQIVKITLGARDKNGVQNLSPIKATYPLSAPKVTSVNFSYRDNNLDVVQSENVIKIYANDTLKLQFQVDEATRKAKELEVLVLRDKGKSSTVTAKRQLNEKKEETEIFELTVENMDKVLVGGERIYVRVVDTEKTTYYENGQEKTRNITYPWINTGLSCAKQSVKVVPQWYESGLDSNDTPLDMPFVGTGSQKQKVDTGLLPYERYDWQNDKGYSWVLNVDASLDKLTYNAKRQKIKNWQDNYHTICLDQLNNKKTKIDAELISNRTLLANTDNKITNLTDQLNKSKLARDKQLGADPEGVLSEPNWSGKITVLMMLDYVKVGNSYRYYQGSIVCGATATAEYTKYIVFHCIPFYINFGLTLQADYAGLFVTPKGVQGLPESKFKEAEGNIKSLVESGQNFNYGEFVFGVTGWIGVGVGIKGILDVKGAVDCTFQVGVPVPKTDPVTKKNRINGYGFNWGGGITLNLLVTSLQFNVIRANKNWGAWATKEVKFQWFGAVETARPKDDPILKSSGANESLRTEELLGRTGNETSYLVEKLAGTDDMSMFGSYEEVLVSGEETENYAYPKLLLENAADNNEVQAVQTAEDGSLFLIFIGNRGNEDGGDTENGNAQALFYTSYNATADLWTKPVLLDPDGTFDVSPSVNMNDGVITVTWSSAEREFKNTDSIFDKLSLLRVKAAVFDVLNDGSVHRRDSEAFVLKTASPSEAYSAVNTDTEFCESASVSEDLQNDGIENENYSDDIFLNADNKDSCYFDAYGESWYANGKVYTVFLRNDLTKAVSAEDIINYTITRPSAWLAENDVSTGELLSIHDLKLTDGNSLLLDIDGEITTVENGEEKKSYIVLSYTKDKDGIFETSEDDLLDLCLIETQKDSEAFVYPSVEITEDPEDETDQLLNNSIEYDVVDSGNVFASRLTKAAGSLWLTYVKDGCILEAVDLGEYLDEMFSEDYLADFFRKKAEKLGGGKYATTSCTSDSWCKTEADELNEVWKEFHQTTNNIWYEKYKDIPEEEKENETGIQVFEDSLIKLFGSGELNATETMLTGHLDEKLGLENYSIVSSGEDIYIVYTDYPANRIQAEKELWCMKFNRPDNETAENVSELEYYFSEPVQLTDARHVISRFSAFMNDGKITVVSDCYDQYIPEGGGITYSPNSIVITEYEPKSIININDSLSGYSFAFNGEEGENCIDLFYTIENIGLEPQAGYKTWILHNGEKIFESDKLTKTIKEIVNIEDEEEEKELIQTLFLRSGETDEWEIPWIIEGSGENEVLTIVVADENDQVLDSMDLTIQRKEQLEVENAETVFTEDGHKAILTVKNTGNMNTKSTTVRLELTDDDGSLKKTYNTALIPALRAGESTILEIGFQPASEDYSMDGTLSLYADISDYADTGCYFIHVAGQPEYGELEGGSTYLTMKKGDSRQLTGKAYPLSEDTGNVFYYTTDPDIVSITEDGLMKAEKNGIAKVSAFMEDWGVYDDITVIVHEYDDEDSIASSELLPAYVDNDGTWKQDEKGNWVYTTRAGTRAKNQWLAIARSTFNGGNGFEWFRFDKDGNMVTGWFRDSDDRMYYLQVISDGNKGRMVTGWKMIDGEWYYFNELSNGYKGALYQNTTTPDGYKVNSKGIWIRGN